MRNALITAALALLLLGACKNKTTSSSALNTPDQQPVASAQQTNMSPEDLGALGAQIHKHPKEAKKILADHGLDEATFEKNIRAVSSDPAQSRRYAAAYKKAS